MATATGTDFRSPISLSQAHFDHISPSVRSAFNLCREADQRLCRGGADSVDNPLYPRLVSVRILGHLLRLAPSFGPASDAASRIAKLIFSAKNPDADDGGGLAQLGSFYDRHLIRTFRKFKGPTPQTSSHHSRPSFNRNAQELQELLIEAPRSHSKAKELALIRDGYRCMLSRRMHAPYWEQIFMLVNSGAQVPSLSITECAHIFSESTNMNLDIPDKRGYTAKAWAILEMFGYPSIREELEGSKIHSLENVLTLECNLHRYFDSLKLWLEAIPDSPNHYRIESIYPLDSLYIDGAEVTFASHIQDPLLPLPNPTYLRIHAACCKVARLSGASGLYDKLERDLESDPDSEMPEFASVLHARLELLGDHA